MLIHNSLPNYIIIRTAIFFLRSITPLSILYIVIVIPTTIAISARDPSSRRTPRIVLPLALGIYPFAETLFYLLVYLPLKSRLQAPATHPLAYGLKERNLLFARILGSVTDVRRYLSGWFYGVPVEEISRQRVKDFVAWSLLNARYEGLTTEVKGEIDGYVDELQERLGEELEQGDEGAKPLRTTFDEVRMAHRPLMWYSIVGLVDTFVHIRMLLGSFDYYRPSLITTLSVFPPRPLALLGQAQKRPGPLAYWYRPHASTSKLPLVFLHGIGVGLYTYVDFLNSINTSTRGRDKHSPLDEGQIGLIVVEILPISARIYAPALTTPETKAALHEILESHGWTDFVLVGHSYGTALASTLLRDPLWTPRIKATMLMDPICFLLHLPDIAYNFTRRAPHNAAEHMLQYFSSLDPLISHTLSRRFFWSEYSLWLEDLPSSLPIVITLSGVDLIVPVREVGAYLTDGALDGTSEGASMAKKERDVREWREGKREVLWFGELNHAGLFAEKWAREKVAGCVRDLCGEAMGREIST
ncbi:hypothetical protein B0A48_13460 [Cryoendolithus antarcticus]|uniref:AB hydrolase-1 domain-containing protein n=1 Tax=Cryoendolithus antarcticus TaxID=1507870 RepID=A0A1V8SPX9_9PEZI|nr:hypothetical protein B0A48_13460 [Cryoendolithus antarcticus]